MARPPFDLTRACFWLLALVMIVIMAETMIALLGCVWMIAVTQHEPIGACAKTGDTIRDILVELLTAILALLVSRGGPPSSPTRTD